MTEDRRLQFTKGHGTENDFVLLPDPDGRIALSARDVQWLTDRRAGIGGDGVIRVVPTRAAGEPEVAVQADRARWFMDYRNADGGLVEMCGNGTRVFAAFLLRQGWETSPEFAIATRAGVKTIRVRSTPEGHVYSVNLGPWRLLDPPAVGAGGSDAQVQVPGQDPWPALRIDVGNPHAVVALPQAVDLESLDLSRAPVVVPHPQDGINVELTRPLGPGHLRMRVHERGVGETRSCGTGAAAAALALMHWAGGPVGGQSWLVDVPGGQLGVRSLTGGEVELSGPAALVADGEVSLPIVSDPSGAG